MTAPSKSAENFHTGQGGFGLIEILVTTALIGILTGTGLASYAKFHERQRVEQSALTFAKELRVVQKRADAGEKPDALCNYSDTLESYRVSAFPSGTDAQIDIECPTARSAGVIPLTQNALFGDRFAVHFKVLGREVAIDPPSGTDLMNEVTVQDIGATYRYKVTVESGGSVTVEKI